MFGFKSTLYVAGLDPMGLELADFSYGLSQNVDDTGKPQGDVYSGTMQLTYPNLPTSGLLEWMLNSRKYKDGMVVVYDEQDSVLLKIVFTKAACVNMDLRYSESGKSYSTTQFTLVAKQMVIGESIVENEWLNI
ncbi:MAG: type VI secretion system needle protein Hcp [Paludibacteraceae bacterium]|nr:type VI secretion system needle protein Hcp [Paludibacteraceae bacterium]MBR5972163.1 type VI secretion system needle protein Hcp [Paludibacteraceae bacterium]